MTAETLQAVLPYVVMVLTLGIVFYTLWKREQPIDLTQLPAQLEEAGNEAEEIAATALVAVQAAEQLWRSGAITRDDRWHEAVAYIKRFYPNLDAEILAKNLESAVFIVNSMVNALPKKENPQ